MTEFLPLSVGIGLAVSLLFTEIFGLAAGGMIVPGYIALYLTRPVEVGLTLAAGLRSPSPWCTPCPRWSSSTAGGARC